MPSSAYIVPLWAKEFLRSVDGQKFAPSSIFDSNNTSTFEYEGMSGTWGKLEDILFMCAIPYESNCLSDDEGYVSEWIHFDKKQVSPHCRHEKKLDCAELSKLVKLNNDGDSHNLSLYLDKLSEENLPHPDFNLSKSEITSWSKLSIAILSGDRNTAEKLARESDEYMKSWVKEGGLHNILNNLNTNKMEDVKWFINLANTVGVKPENTQNRSKRYRTDNVGWGLALLDVPEFYRDRCMEVISILHPNGGRHDYDERMVADLQKMEEYNSITALLHLDAIDMLPQSIDHIQQLANLVTEYNSPHKKRISEVEAKLQARVLAEKASTVTTLKPTHKRISL